MYDIAIIGGGVTGCAIARFLSKYDARICLIEKEEDVCSGTSKANSAIVHAGFDAPVGSNKAKYNVRGNQLIHELSEQLGFPFIENGSLVVCTKDQNPKDLDLLLEKGISNGVKDLKILNREELLEIEPNIADDVIAALFAPSGGICCPFNMTYAFADNAADNGVEFILNSQVVNISKADDIFTINLSQSRIDLQTGDIIDSKQDLQAKYIINAAGLYADEINNMISDHKYHITPRKGEYMLLDTTAGNHVSHTIFQLPSKMGKGILVTPTVHGNLLVGPTASDISDKDGTNTTAAGLEEVQAKAANSIKDIPFRTVITSFAGLRAVEDCGDFVIARSQDVDCFYNVLGIQSPGLSAAPAIAEQVACDVSQDLSLVEKEDYLPNRPSPTRTVSMTIEEMNKLISHDPRYGNIVCRCCSVTEGEILEAIHASVPAISLDAIKRRSGAMMGRCQGGFCSPKIYEIMTRELGYSPEAVNKSGSGSNLTYGPNKHV